MPTDVPPTESDPLDAVAEAFASLADATRVRILHSVATDGPAGIGSLADRVGVSQPTASHHVKLLAAAGLVRTDRRGTSTVVSVDTSCCSGLPHAVDVVMGVLTTPRCCPEDIPTDVHVRPMRDGDATAVRAIYADGIGTGLATFDTEVPAWDVLDARWLPDQRLVAEIDGAVVGWAAVAPVSGRACYAGVGESSVYVGEAHRGRRVGVALIDAQVRAADAGGLWTLQASVLPANTASLRLHAAAGFRTVGVRERIARHHGEWSDVVLLERRRAEV